MMINVDLVATAYRVTVENPLWKIGIRFTFTVEKNFSKTICQRDYGEAENETRRKIAIIISLCDWRESWRRTKVVPRRWLQLSTLAGRYL